MSSFRFGNTEARPPVAAFPAAASSAFSRMMRMIEDRRHAKAMKAIQSRRPCIQATHGEREAKNLTEQFAQARRHRDHERQIDNAFIAERLCKIHTRRPIFCDPKALPRRDGQSGSGSRTRGYDPTVFERLSASAKQPESPNPKASRSPSRSRPNTPRAKSPWRPSSAPEVAAEAAARSDMANEVARQCEVRCQTRTRSASHGREMARMHQSSLPSGSSGSHKPQEALVQARRMREKKIQLENQYIGQRLLHIRSHYSHASFERHEVKHLETLYRLSANPRMGNSLAHLPSSSTMQYRTNMQKIIDATWAGVGTRAPPVPNAPPGFRKREMDGTGRSPRAASPSKTRGGMGGETDATFGIEFSSARQRAMVDDAIEAGDLLFAQRRKAGTLETSPSPRRRAVPQRPNSAPRQSGIDGDDEDSGDDDTPHFASGSSNRSLRVPLKDLVNESMPTGDITSPKTYSSRRFVASIYDVDPDITPAEIRQRLRQQIQRNQSQRSQQDRRQTGSATSEKPLKSRGSSAPFISPSIDIEVALADILPQTQEPKPSERFTPRRFATPETYHKLSPKAARQTVKMSARKSYPEKATQQSQAHADSGRDPFGAQIHARSGKDATKRNEKSMDTFKIFAESADCGPDAEYFEPSVPLRFPLERAETNSSGSVLKPAFMRIID